MISAKLKIGKSVQTKVHGYSADVLTEITYLLREVLKSVSEQHNLTIEEVRKEVLEKLEFITLKN